MARREAKAFAKAGFSATVSLRALIAAYFLGGLSEYASFWRISLINLVQSKSELNAEILRFNEGDPRVSGMELAPRTEIRGRDKSYPDKWYLLERSRPAKQYLSKDDSASFGSDSRYRITAARVGELVGLLPKG